MSAISSASVQSEPSLFLYPDRDTLGRAAARQSAEIISRALQTRGSARILVATGNSQLSLIEHLAAAKLDWGRVDAFHLDEYVGISGDHPASFRHWIRTRFEEKVHPRSMHYLMGDAPDPDAEARRYASLLLAGPIDLAFVGIGENGHIAFNDPHVADFNDPLTVKRVVLDEACRAQQVHEGHFPDDASVPREALSVTCTGLMRAYHWVCSVPEARKANAVRASLEGPLTPACPGSLVRRHPCAFIYLDHESASKLTWRFPKATATR
jgi:glucosamine-6-phosphate deaminase